VGANGKVTLVEADSDSLGVGLGEGVPESLMDHALTEGDRAAVKDYTGPGYTEINRVLRGDLPMDPEIAARADAVSNALAKLPDAPGPAFRGGYLTSEQISSYVPGTSREDPAFVSSSSDPNEAFGGNTLFLIMSKHGKDVTLLSRVPEESEILFDKGSRFYVQSNYFDTDLNKHIIQLVEE